MDLFKKTRGARIEDALCLKKKFFPAKNSYVCTAVSRGEVSSRFKIYNSLFYNKNKRERERSRRKKERERAHLYSSPRSRRPRVLFKKACDRFCADVRRTTTTARVNFYAEVEKKFAASQKKSSKSRFFKRVEDKAR